MSNSAFTPSNNLSLPATPAQAGTVSTTAQTFAGEKTFTSNPVIDQGGNSALQIKASGSDTWELQARTTGDFRISNITDGAVYGAINTSGTWTLGASGGTQTHIVNGSLDISTSLDAPSMTTNGIVVAGTSPTVITTGARIKVAITGSTTPAWVSAAGTSSTRNHLVFEGNTGTTQAVIGWISTASGATSYSTTSDYRLKQNNEKIQNALEKVEALKPYTYEFKASPGVTHQGFFAHELQEVIPLAVTGAKDEIDEEQNPVYQGVDLAKVVPLLTAAIQELKAELDDAKAKIAALEVK